jgi:hypothetical protein
MNNNVSFPDSQKKYALRMAPCVPVDNNLMVYKVDGPFVFLHAFIVDESDNSDRYSDMSQGMNNALLYLDPHPVLQVMNIAEITSFHVSAGNYYVADLRPVDFKSQYRQYVFVLLCLNY